FSYFFFSSRRRHTRSKRDWSSDVCSSDLQACHHILVVGAFSYPYVLITHGFNSFSDTHTTCNNQGLTQRISTTLLYTMPAFHTRHHNSIRCWVWPPKQWVASTAVQRDALYCGTTCT